MGRASTSVTSPTKPSRAFSARARISPPSMPARPIARPPMLWISATRLLFTLPASTIWTISAVSASVTRRPSTNSLVLPTRLSIRLISGPPPWTSTGFTPTSDSSTISRMTACLRCSSVMALPPYFTTTILPVYC